MSNYDLKAVIERDVDLAIQEDVGSGDLTAFLIPEKTLGQGAILSRVDCVLSGSEWANTTFQKLDPAIRLDWHFQDGDRVTAGEILCTLRGPARGLLTGERTALNFLQTLSAVATKTRRYVDAISHTKTTILDTRKTLPGLRNALKYAVVIGGGKNHRIGLYDGVLIKENHITASNGISAALAATRHIDKSIPIQVEVESLEQLEEALDNGANLILLDNFTVPDMKDAVALTNKRALLEASGGITLSSIVAIAETGVDRISIGALTKDIESIDLSMRLVF
ncbi:MAG: carboxylating nicotinate-nucleotide diphosphorylase [Proteobacteria bacterium]|nr:carboxylating nicotinate-nucleotide diphosphorylase [Pseudomonadota bacterium]MDA1331854.1 carboxylating nicotinate-nucleotide diphosphorylase [Pseudomonadota bacterium]